MRLLSKAAFSSKPLAFSSNTKSFVIPDWRCPCGQVSGRSFVSTWQRQLLRRWRSRSPARFHLIRKRHRWLCRFRRRVRFLNRFALMVFSSSCSVVPSLRFLFLTKAYAAWVGQKCPTHTGRAIFRCLCSAVARPASATCRRCRGLCSAIQSCSYPTTTRRAPGLAPPSWQSRP
jgi:hypothetical protein